MFPITVEDRNYILGNKILKITIISSIFFTIILLLLSYIIPYDFNNSYYSTVINIITGFIGILFAIIIFLIQNVSTTYSPKISKYLVKDKNIL